MVNTTTVALFFAATAGLFWFARGRRQSLGVAAAFAVLVLLSMYHRYYDAGLVVLPIAWALATLAADPEDLPVAPAGYAMVNVADRRARRAAIAVLVACAAFCLPSEWLVKQFRESTVQTQHAFWFNWLAEPHHAWELLAIGAAVAVALFATRDRPDPVAGPVPAAAPWWGRHGVRLAVAALVPLAALYGWWITPGRDDYKECDYAMYYTASRTFLAGQNPYSRWHAFDTWYDNGNNGDWDVMNAVLGPNPYDDEHADDYWLPVNCIPPALVAFAPFAYFRVPVAFPMWNVFITLLLGLEVWAVIKLMGVRLWSTGTMWVVMAILVTDPTHIGYANGQPSLPAVSLTAIACWLAVADWQLTAGLCLAVATAFKPQLAGPFVLVFAWQGKWRAVIAAAVVGTAMTLGAVIPLMVHDHGPHHLDWLRGWIGEVKFAELPGGVNDVRRANEGRHDMVHLQVLLHFFSDNPTLVNVMTEAVVIAMGGLLWWTAGGRRTDLLAIAAFCPLPLLFAYHRLYDCGILILPVGWAILNCRRGVGRWPARVVLLAFGVYAISQGELQDHIFGGGKEPQIGSGWWFDLFLEPHHTWGLLAIYASLVWTLWRERAATTASDGPRSVGFPVLPTLAPA